MTPAGPLTFSEESREERARAIIVDVDPTPIATGLRGEARRMVSADLTAEALGSGDVPSFGTPAVLALIEEAACNAVRASLPDGATSVGVWVELEHVAPSKIGAEVTAVAVLTDADVRTLEFACEARDADRVVAKARHRRAIVDRARFVGRL